MRPDSKGGKAGIEEQGEKGEGRISWKMGNACRGGSRQLRVRDTGRPGRIGARYREYAVLADRFPANNWKCKRNRPRCDSSIIESLISVWMRPLSRSHAPFALILALVPSHLLSYARRVLFLPHKPALSSIPPPRSSTLLQPLRPRHLHAIVPREDDCASPRNEQMQVQVRTCC